LRKLGGRQKQNDARRGYRRKQVDDRAGSDGSSIPPIWNFVFPRKKQKGGKKVISDYRLNFPPIFRNKKAALSAGQPF